MPMWLLYATVAVTPAPAPARAADHGDVALYRAIAAEVRQGRGYYQTAFKLQTERHFPTRPFYTVRPPTLAWINALLGDNGLRGLGVIATFAVALLWMRRLRGLTSRFVAGMAVVGTSLPLALSPLVFVHDYWSGLLISAALAMKGPGGRAALGLLAVAVRELCFPFLWVLVTFEKRRRHAVAACAVAIVGLSIHAWLVPAGGRQSPGWLGLRGPVAALRDMVEMTPLLVLPPVVALALCASPVFGWLKDRIALVWFAGFWTMIAALSRTDNPNWVLNLLPAWFLGWALLAERAADAARTRRGKRGSSARLGEQQTGAIVGAARLRSSLD